MSFTLKQFLPRSLLGRSLLILILPVLLIQVITTFVFFDRHWGKVTARLAYAVAGEVAIIVDAYAEEEAGGIDIEGLAQDFKQYLSLSVSLLDGALPEARYNPATQMWENIVADRLRHEMTLQVDRPFTLDFNFEDKVVTVYVAMDDGVLKIMLPQRRLFSSSGYVFLLWVAGASIVLLVLSILFMRNQVRPIRRLAVAADRFGRGQDVPKFKPEGANEVRQAARAFIDMRRRIQRQVSQRTDMLAGVSHDLRTPLTRLNLELEMLSETVNVEGMKQDVHEMERMVAGYIDFVRGDGEEQFEFIELKTLFDKMIAALNRQRVAVAQDVEEGLRVRVRPLAFERALNNLMVNASKYGEHVWVSAFLDDGKVHIQIEDDGPGIAEEMLSEVFKPFKRVDDSRNAETGGVGLGLSIAMDIVQSHGGNIELSTSTYGGLCAVVRLPV
jgi:two-component system osmolarity sensor histidine kinase EnvZ